MLQLEDVQRRAEAAEAALQEERSAHRRALRHKNSELAEAQVTQDAALCCAMSLYPSVHVALLRTRAVSVARAFTWCVDLVHDTARLACILGTLLHLSAGNIMSVSEGEKGLHRRR